MDELLSADIGGTKTLLQICQYSNNKLHISHKRNFTSAGYADFSSMLRDFLPTEHNISVACIAAAGAIEKLQGSTKVDLTNLPWQIDNQLLSQQFNIPDVTLINDFSAVGYSVEHLRSDDLVTLQPGIPKANATRAIIGAGTGLGEAILTYNGQHYDVIDSEGGHVDFAPTNDMEVVFFQHLNNRYPHVSYERVVSGQGLVNIFEFLMEVTGQSDNKSNIEILNSSDPAAKIAIENTQKTNNLATLAFEMFMKIYGAQAGNLALTCLARGGVYLAGGIASKNVAAFKQKEFLNAFCAKGRMQKILTTIPVHIIINQEAGLIGATHFARNRLIEYKT